MSMLKVACEDQRLYLLESTTIASGGVNETKVHFEFCPKWDGYVKTAVFYQNVGDAYYAKIGTDNMALIPWEVTRNPGFMYFGVFGVKDGISRTSEVMGVRIVPGAITAEIVPAEPTPDVYIQFLSEYAVIREMMITVEQNTAASAASAQQSAESASASETRVEKIKTDVEALVNGLDDKVEAAETEIDTFVNAQKTEIDNFTEECKQEIVDLTNGDMYATKEDLANIIVNSSNIASNAVSKSLTVTLAPESWPNNEQTVTASGVTASNTVIVTPAPASFLAYAEAQVRCTAQAANSLTFLCETVPTAALTVNVTHINK